MMMISFHRIGDIEHIFMHRRHERHRYHQFQPVVVQEPDSEIVKDVDRLGS